MTRHVKQHRFTNPPPNTGSCTVAVPGAVFRYLGFSLRGLAGQRVLPSSLPDGALGVLFLCAPTPLVYGKSPTLL
jgi:hypothetical protein